MTDVDKVKNMAECASFFEEGNGWLRIIYCDNEAGFFSCTDEEGCEYEIKYNEVDLNAARFYKAVLMDPKDYENVQALPG